MYFGMKLGEVWGRVMNFVLKLGEGSCILDQKCGEGRVRRSLTPGVYEYSISYQNSSHHVSMILERVMYFRFEIGGKGRRITFYNHNENVVNMRIFC
jgi:hypothetical protein